MKKLLILGAWLSASCLGAQPVTPTPTAAPVTLVRPWDPAQAPWEAWFKKNALVSDKADYVELFWNAQDFKANFQGPDQKVRFAEAALELVDRLYPAGAKADRVKVDIVYVLERDSYGEPSWDSLQQAAHLEISRAKAASFKAGTALTEADLKKLFLKVEIY